MSNPGFLSAPPRAHNHLIARGICLYLGAIFLMAIMDALTKWLSQTYPVGQIVFFRAFSGLLPIAILVWRNGGVPALRTKRLGAHAARGLIGLTATATFFYAFSVMPLADAYAIAFAAPLFVTALSVPMLGERVGSRRWAAVLVGFIGVIIMLRPGAQGVGGFLSLGALAALVGTFSYALVVTTARSMGQSETPAAMGFYPAVIVAIASIGLLSFGFVMPTPGDFLLLCVLGLVGSTGIILINEAFRTAPSAVLAPFDYSAMLWALIFGFAIWSDVPSLVMLGGAAIVAASGLYILRRETAAHIPPVARAARARARAHSMGP